MIDKKAWEFPSINSLVNAFKPVASAILSMGGWAYAGGIGLGAAMGYGASKLTSPTSIAENSDKELEEEALRTEIDVTQRKLMALDSMQKLQNKQKASAVPYDRFVG